MPVDPRRRWNTFQAFAASTYPGFGNLGFRITLLGLAAFAFPVVFGLELVRHALDSRGGPDLALLILGTALVVAPLGFVIVYAVALIAASRGGKAPAEGGES